MAFSYHSKTPCLAFVNIYKYSFCFARAFFFPFFFKKLVGFFFFFWVTVCLMGRGVRGAERAREESPYAASLMGNRIF